MVNGPPSKKAKTEDFAVFGEEAITFKIFTPDCHEQASQDTFRPLMTHQILGDEEKVYGYSSPELTISLNLATYEVSTSFRHDGVEGKTTDIDRLVREGFKDAALANLDELLHTQAQLLTSSAEHLGVEVNRTKGSGNTQTSVHWSNLSRSHEALKAIHSRAQLLLPFFIDGATGIDQADVNWELAAAMRMISGVCCIVGFCTAYRVYAYAESSRLRVSQLFVLPPFQRQPTQSAVLKHGSDVEIQPANLYGSQGIGRQLLEAVYSRADTEDLQDIITAGVVIHSRPPFRGLVDLFVKKIITPPILTCPIPQYEDPTEDVEAMREKIELARCRQCSWLVKSAVDQQQAIGGLNEHSSESSLQSVALPAEQVKKAQKELRLTKQQVQKAWEVLLAEQPAFQREPASSVLRGLIARRLLGKFSDTEKQAVGKRIFGIENQWGESYIMHRVPNIVGTKGVPVAMDDKQEKGQSREEREQAWEEAVEARWHVVTDLAGWS